MSCYKKLTELFQWPSSGVFEAGPRCSSPPSNQVTFGSKSTKNLSLQDSVLKDVLGLSRSQSWFAFLQEFRCRSCQRSFARELQLAQHFRMRHKGHTETQIEPVDNFQVTLRFSAHMTRLAMLYVGMEIINASLRQFGDLVSPGQSPRDTFVGNAAACCIFTSSGSWELFSASVGWK